MLLAHNSALVLVLDVTGTSWCSISCSQFYWDIMVFYFVYSMLLEIYDALFLLLDVTGTSWCKQMDVSFCKIQHFESRRAED